MPTPPASVPLSVEQLLEAVKHLSQADRRKFQRRLTAWQDQNDHPAADEAGLVRTARARLAAADDRRLKRLIAKSERGTLTPKELAEYRSLARRAQQLDAARLEAVAELARRRGKPARAIMEEIGCEGAHGP